MDATWYERESERSEGSCPDLKHLTMLGTLSPDLNVARVPSQKIGRKLGTHKGRPHKRSDAELEAFNVGPER